MCGIFSYIGTKESYKYLLEGLIILQNRGYDSVGITTIRDNQFITSKYASQETTSDAIKSLEDNIEKHKGAYIGISHTRWATHGPKTVKNCHPHFDNTQRFCIVHNGIIENYLELREFLLEQNINCKTDTDTEVIVQLIGYFSHTHDFITSVNKTIEKLEGTWGLVILDIQNPDTILVTRRGSPMLIGIGKDDYYISSEVAAFQRHTTHYISLYNDEIVTIKGKRIYIDSNSLTDRLQVSQNNETILLRPDPYPHWTIREIKEQEYTITKALNNGGRIYNDHSVVLGGLNKNKSLLLSIRDLIIIGCGTSKNAGEYVSNIFRKISGFNTVQVIDASEFNADYIREGVGVLALSQSGETQDVIRCLNLLPDDIPMFSVINKVDSQIARMTNCGVYLNAGREVAVASTKAFTSCVVVLFLIAVWFAQNRNIQPIIRTDIIKELNKTSLLVSNILNNDMRKIDQTVNYINQHERIFVLGKGLGLSIAEEGALKIKEITYLHAEAYPGGSLKHGPFALISKGIPIIFILTNDTNRSYMESTINEVRSRGGYVITITDIPDHNLSDICIKIPNNGLLTNMLAVIIFQLIAYKLSIKRRIDPDKPKHLAKVVTVI